MQSLFDPIHQESSVPLGQRFLMLEGRFELACIEDYIHRHMPSALTQYDAQLTVDWRQAVATYQHRHISQTNVYVAISFAYAQLPIGKTFEILCPADQPEAAIRSPSILVASINEMIPLPMPCIEAGHRSICLFDFPDGVPSLIENLSVVERFMQRPSTENVWLTSMETLHHLLAKKHTRNHISGAGKCDS